MTDLQFRGGTLVHHLDPAARNRVGQDTRAHQKGDEEELADHVCKGFKVG